MNSPITSSYSLRKTQVEKGSTTAMKQKLRGMAADHSSHVSFPKSGKRRPSTSKAELKMSLVAKRLAMLQDDYIEPVPIEISRCHERDNTKVIREKSVDNILVSDHASLQLCESTKVLVEVSDHSSSENFVPMSTQNRRRHGSHKRSKVISDDESEGIGEHYDWIPPTEKGRTKRERVLSNDLLDHENFEASDAPRKRRIKKVEQTDDSSADNKSSAMKRAKEFQANLSVEFPSFVKLMLPSHVYRVYWLGLPKGFCKDYLPIGDCKVVLVDEAGKEFETNYLAHKTALSGGWRGFARQHKLEEHDAVIFHLIAPTKFKVYIVREDNLGEVDGALGLLTLDTGAGKFTSETEDHSQKVLHIEDNFLLDSLSPSNSQSDFDVGSEVLDGIQFLDCIVDFEAVKGFKNFKISIDGLIMDSRFSETIREKYYKLCCCQGSFLHEHLLKGLNCDLVVGIISETVNIADAIRVCTASTSVDDLKIWEKTLKGFKLLGMEVAFLLDKLNTLLNLAPDFDIADESNMLKMCMVERASAIERMTVLKNKLTELKSMMNNIDMEMEAEMKASSQKYKAKVKEVANSLW